MISSTPPYHVIQGYTLLPDHADQQQYYVLPPAPTLALEADGHPSFSLVQYLNEGAGSAKLVGGLLTLTTMLDVSDSLLADLGAKLASRLGGSNGVLRLSPVLYDSGTVELIALGSTSGVGGITESNDGSEGSDSVGGSPTESSVSKTASGPFQIQFLGAGRPSLGGTNRAVFQLLLDEPSAKLVEQCLEAPDLPLIAIYRLNFAALRPSYKIKIEADWSKVYHSLQEKAKANLWIIAGDAERLVQDTLQEQNIQIQTDVFGTGPGAQSAAERARHQLVEWTLERFFAPQADPAAATANTIGKVIDGAVWSLVHSVLPGVGYQLRDIEESELRFFSARMEEAVAEVRQVIPQGTLGGMLNQYRVDEAGQVRSDWEDRRARLLTTINLKGFPRLEVQVGVEDHFEDDGLSQIQVELERLDSNGGSHDLKSFVFRSAAERQAYIVNLLGEDPLNLGRFFHFRSTVVFDPAGPFGPHPPVQSGWQDSNVPELYIEPRAVYGLKEVKIIAAPGFPFIQFSAVTIEFRYLEEGSQTQQTGWVVLNAEQPQGVWRYTDSGSRLSACEYRLTYHRLPQAGGAIVTNWQPYLGQLLSIPDPMPYKRSLNLFASLPWPEIAIAFVQFRYDDDVHGIHYEEQINLNSNTSYVSRDYPIHADGPRTLAYRLTILLTSGGLMEGSWRETDDDRLMLDRRLIDYRHLTVRSLGGSLAQNKLRVVKLRLRVLDPNNGKLREETELSIPPGEEAQPLTWEYLLGDPPARSVQYTVSFVDNNGFVVQLPAAQTRSDLLIVRLNTKTISS